MYIIGEKLYVKKEAEMMMIRGKRQGRDKPKFLKIRKKGKRGRRKGKGLTEKETRFKIIVYERRCVQYEKVTYLDSEMKIRLQSEQVSKLVWLSGELQFREAALWES